MQFSPAHMRSDASHDRLGKYLVLDRIGKGGMAEVFKCRLSGIGGFDKLVVIKRIRPELVREPDFLAMFLDEARIAASLSHGNIVQTFEIDQAGGLPFLVMEYVRGPTLSELTRRMRARGKPNVALAAKVMSGICAGLDHAHRATDEQGAPLGIVHRDVTPQNILVSLDGVPKLFDFGVARARGQIAPASGTIKGKFTFMAPEAFLAEGDHVSPRLDVFAAGVCLYHATTYRLPYRGSTELDVLRAAAKGKFARPSELVPGFCPRLEEIIVWAMAPDPKDRCPDALTLHRQLEEYAQQRGCTQSTVLEQLRELCPLESSPAPAADCDVQSADIVVTSPPRSLTGGGRCASVARRQRWRAKKAQAPQPLEAARPSWLVIAAVALIGAETFATRFYLPTGERIAPAIVQAPAPAPDPIHARSGPVCAPEALIEAVPPAPPAPPVKQVPRKPRLPEPGLALSGRGARLMDAEWGLAPWIDLEPPDAAPQPLKLFPAPEVEALLLPERRAAPGRHSPLPSLDSL